MATINGLATIHRLIADLHVSVEFSFSLHVHVHVILGAAQLGYNQKNMNFVLEAPQSSC